VISSEQIARKAFADLPARSRSVVLEWRQRGVDWCTAMLSSNALGRGALITPDEAERQADRESFYQQLLEWQIHLSPPTQESRRRESAEHEAAHTIVAQALGLPVRFTRIGADHSGSCVYTSGTELQNATVTVAGELWIDRFRGFEHPNGPTGCGGDRKVAAQVDEFILRKARNDCMKLLKENRAIVLATADRIERDGFVLPW
jgi:hypothetical protein